ncbi:MAG: TonB-dependent receptor plug domain-containing protein [Bacteroidetes bacterium]|nr:TonB-dependent receptor plug domain-containing protein [Bacteroidota bacterium]
MKGKIFTLLALCFYLFPPFLQAQEVESYSYLGGMSLEELLNIEITTAGKKSEKITDVPASVVLITKDDINKYGYLSVEEILENVPGLYLIDDYNWLGQKNFGVRGYFSTGAFDNMIVLINGVNQKSEGLLDSYPTERIEVPVESISRIEIIRGPMSVMYGSGAFFGAINIITNNSSDYEEPDLVTASVGNQNIYRLYAGFKGKTGDFHFSLNGYLISDNGIDVPFSKMMTDPSVVTNTADDGGWNLNSDRTKNRLKTRREYFNINGTFKDLTFDFGLVHSRKNVAETIFGVGDGSWVHYNNAHASLFYNKTFSDVFSLETKFGFFSDNHWVDNNFYYENSYTNNWSRANIYEIELIGRIKPAHNISIVAGLFRRTVFDLLIEADYTGLGYLPNLEIVYPDLIVNNAFYVQLDYGILEDLKLVSGVRFERLNPYKYDLNLNFPEPETLGTNQPPVVIHGEFIPENEIVVIPRLGFIYSFKDNHIIKLLYGQAIKQPHATANLDVAINNSPQLKPAEIETFELNYTASIFPNVVTNFSLFHNRLNNLISRINILTDEQSVIISTNAGKVTTVGIEAGLQTRIFSSLQFDFNITYQNSKNLQKGFEDIELGYSPHILANSKISYEFSQDFIFGLSSIYVGEMYTDWRTDSYNLNNYPVINLGDPLQGRLGYTVPAHIVFDANLRVKNIFDSGLYLNAKVSNIFDEDILFPTTTSNPAFDKGTMGRQRTFVFTLGWQ